MAVRVHSLQLDAGLKGFRSRQQAHLIDPRRFRKADLQEHSGRCGSPGLPARDQAVVEGKASVPGIRIGVEMPASVRQYRGISGEHLELGDLPHPGVRRPPLDCPEAPKPPWREVKIERTLGTKAGDHGGPKDVGERFILSRVVPDEDLASGPGFGNLIEGEDLFAGRDFALDQTVDEVAGAPAREVGLLRFDAERRSKGE